MNPSEQYTFENPFIGAQSLIIPSSLKALARWRFKALQKEQNSAEIDFRKAESLLESFLTRKSENPETGQRATHALCQQLSARPFWEAGDSELLNSLAATLKEHIKEIQAEYLSANQQQSLAQEINTGKGFLEHNSWLNIRLGSLGFYSKNAQALFPKTIALLAPYQKRIFSAEFIIMESGTRLPPHTDATNAYLVSHLGLIVPENCGFQVKDQIREFYEGDVVFFDQSFVHSAWNQGETQRVNLLLTLFHPEINDKEVEMILRFIRSIKNWGLLFSPVIGIEFLVRKVFSIFNKAST